jgi:rhodanese-related sulfurtransferase
MWPKTTRSTEISAIQAYQKYQEGAFFLDVRTQAEWEQMHIAKSSLIPLDELQNRLSELPRDRDIVVVCLSGHRSKEGMTILQQAGFSRATCMTGGLTAWKEAGYPLETLTP